MELGFHGWIFHERVISIFLRDSRLAPHSVPVNKSVLRSSSFRFGYIASARRPLIFLRDFSSFPQVPFSSRLSYHSVFAHKKNSNTFTNSFGRVDVDTPLPSNECFAAMPRRAGWHFPGMRPSFPAPDRSGTDTCYRPHRFSHLNHLSL